MGCGGSKSGGTHSGSMTPRRPNQRPAKGNKTSRGKNKIPINEKGYKKRIRENLRQSAAGNDIDELQKNMETFVNNHMEDGGDYTEAERRLDFLLIRKDIRDACMRKHPEVLDRAIHRVESSPYKQKLRPYLDRAYLLKKQQNALDTYRHDIGDIDQATISEIRSYTHPQAPVHTTMIAACMVMGHKEEHLVDWTEITALMSRYGKDSFLREVRQVDPSRIDNNTGLRARNYLCQYSLDEVRLVSNGAASFYVWTSNIVGKYDPKGKKSADLQTKPLKNSGGKGQQPGSQPVTPASQTKPPADAGRDKKRAKQRENKTKQQQDNKSKVVTKDTKATTKNVGNKQTNPTTAGKTTKKG